MKQEERKPVSEKTAYQRMARLCSMKECCSSDVRQKLRRMQLGDDAVNNIISLLLKQKYIDDTRFTRSFISDKLRFGKWGKTKIVFSLRQKQIPQEIIDEVFQTFSDEVLLQPLMPLLEKKLKSVKGKTEYEKRDKVIRFALSRGFSMPNILKCLGEMPED